MTLYFQVQGLKLKFTETEKAQLQMHWKVRERKKVSSLKKYHQGPEKKMPGTKERYRDPESIRQYGNTRKILNKKKDIKKMKKKYLGNPKQKRECEKNMQTIPNEKENMKQTNMRKILNQKENKKKDHMTKILNQKENMKKQI